MSGYCGCIFTSIGLSLSVKRCDWLLYKVLDEYVQITYSKENCDDITYLNKIQRNIVYIIGSKNCLKYNDTVVCKKKFELSMWTSANQSLTNLSASVVPPKMLSARVKHAVYAICTVHSELRTQILLFPGAF